MPPTPRFKIEGLKTVLTAHKKAKDKTAIAIDEGLLKAAQMVFTASQKLVPVDTGLLKSSGKVEKGSGKGFSASASVVYDAPYATVVHEDLQAHHNPPTQARYVSAAIAKVRGSIATMMKRDVQIALNPS